MKTTRLLALGMLGVMTAAAAQGAALITKGANELAVEGQLDFATAAGTDLKLEMKYAYFIMDRISVGVQGVLANNDAVSAYGIGATAEYNFVLPVGYKPMFGTDLVPYLGIGVDYRHAELFDETESAVVFGGEAGVKFFLTDTTALALGLVGEYATEDIYVDDLDATDKDLSLRLGMRFYF